jgi:2-polyprenyl-3-methyl-5-hydroxy-6-metoxy-1,4-benzoquinol methylase
MAKPISYEKFKSEFLTMDALNAEDLALFSTTAVNLPVSGNLRELDPLSLAYKQQVLAEHQLITGRHAPYEPALNEKAAEAHFTDDTCARNVHPWSYADPLFLSEFLHSWAQIFRMIDLKSPGSVLEYGPGSGQALLMLARCGLDCHAVDIEQRWLDQIASQAQKLSLSISLEQGVFGEGFTAREFDRIIFFESFHHCIDFHELLKKLHSKLKAGGKIVFCGEPLFGMQTDMLPYPWGLRRDAASLWCMNRCGWMELGFTQQFFVELLMRTGYSVRYFPFPACPRAEGYVAEPSQNPVFTTEEAGPQPNILRKYMREVAKDLRRYLLKYRSSKIRK